MSTRSLPDPDTSRLEPDWDAFRSLGHRMVDDACDWLASLRERPVWQPVPEGVRERLRAPLPREGQGLDAAYRDFVADVRPYALGNVHPRFYGWVNGSAVPAAVYADLLASLLNSNVAACDHGAIHVEEQVVGWAREMLGLPAGWGGLLTSGGSMANVIALAAARTARAGADVRERGVCRLERPLVVYGSDQAHDSNPKALELLGLGREAFHAVPTDGELRIDLAALERAVAEDRAAGRRPIAVIGSAGTVNTGAVDDLAGLAALARREGLWFHVDGAIGALGWLCPELRPLLAGMQEADSIAFDLHKWLFLPNDVGCVLLRDPSHLTDTFAGTGEYLAGIGGGLTRTGRSFKDMGPELTRRFRALKVWFSVKAHGADAFAETIRMNLLQARHLARLVAEHPRLELVNDPVRLCIVALRHAAPGVPCDVADDLNRELLIRLQESGDAVPSHTRLGGRFVLRVSITNHRTRLEDLEFLADRVAALGDELAEEYATRGRLADWVRSGRTDDCERETAEVTA